VQAGGNGRALGAGRPLLEGIALANQRGGDLFGGILAACCPKQR